MSQPCIACSRPAVERDFSLCSNCSPRVSYFTKKRLMGAIYDVDIASALAQVRREALTPKPVLL